MTNAFKQLLPDRVPTRDEIAWLLLPVVVALSLLAFDRFGIDQRFIGFYGAHLEGRGWSVNDIRLAAQAWLTSSCVILFAVGPGLFMMLFADRRIWGLGIGQAARNLPVYAAILGLMLPLLWLASGQNSFNSFYPLYDPPTWRLWIAFEVIYLAQFFCVEFFFRGPILFRLESRFGHAAIGMMVVPYALIHIYKPIPEALGSIVAGFVLGYLALKARSVWPGVFLHVSVAFSMDMFALLRSGRMALLAGG